MQDHFFLRANITYKRGVEPLAARKWRQGPVACLRPRISLDAQCASVTRSY